MPGQRSQLQDDVRFRILRHLLNNPEKSQRELARVLGLSIGSVHYALSALIDRGLVKLGNFTAAKDKRLYAYLLTPIGLAKKTVLTHGFLRRKLAECEVLKAEIDALSREADCSAPTEPDRNMDKA